MNNLIKILILFCLSGLIGCTIGNGHICGPQTPQAYCDREAYERLIHPKASASIARNQTRNLRFGVRIGLSVAGWSTESTQQMNRRARLLL